MLATLTAALSLAASLAIDVPYLPQTDALCGGAAAAMVLRYRGDAHADAQAFAALVDRRAGGIAAGALTSAIAARGWRVEHVEGTLEALAARVRDRQPVIVLLPNRRDRYHYVVVVGTEPDAIVVHDPAWGPSRTIRAPDFERAWKAAGFWSLVVLPAARDDGSERTRPASPATAVGRVLLDPPRGTNPPDATPPDDCDMRLNDALAAIQAQGPDRAEAILAEVRDACPGAAGPLREMSGLRFAQRRWADAAALARDALGRDPHDAYALDVLGSSLFMQDDEDGALRAWNQIGKPRVNRVRIDGLHHTRYQTVAEVMAIQPNMLLTADAFARARRRLGALPDRATMRLAVRPEADGFATVDVVLVEIAAVPRGPLEWAGAAAKGAAQREIEVSAPGRTGQGEVWSAGWRWWSNRPGVSAAFAAPMVRGLPGVWRVDGAWESDTYGGAGRTDVVESRTHGALTVSDWLSGRLRYSATAGLDAWSGGRKAASIGGAIERATLDDRVSLTADATQWIPIAGGPAFRSAGARLSGRSSADTRGWVTRGVLGVQRVSDAAPLSLWPGAGEGLARAPLLRAHPLLSDGVIDVTGSSAFGRSLAFGSAELQRWLERPSLVRVAVAGFADLARASRTADGAGGATQTDLGVGLRLRMPGSPGVLRVDVAHGLRDGANALTVGWMF